MPLSVTQFENGKWRENSYVVSNSKQEALIIDPGLDAGSVLDYIAKKRINALAILNTHAHYDHVGAVSEIKDKISIPFYLHSGDKRLLRNANLYVKLFNGDSPIQIPKIDFFLDQLDSPVRLGNFSIQIFETPGHTLGSVSLQIENCLFTGDSLFHGKIGRTDLPGGDPQLLKASLKVIASLRKDLVIFPGHGKKTILTHELKFNNDFIQAIE